MALIPLNHTKAQIRHILQHKFYPLDFLEPEQLAYFKLLRWQGAYLQEILKNGTIHRDSLQFLPVYIGCTPTEAFESSQISVSFRTPADRTICPGYGYALIKIVKESTNG